MKTILELTDHANAYI